MAGLRDLLLHSRGAGGWIAVASAPFREDAASVAKTSRRSPSLKSTAYSHPPTSTVYGGDLSEIRGLMWRDGERLIRNLCINNWRWAGVPFLIRSGKSLPMTVTEVRVRLKQAPVALFGSADASANEFYFRLSSDVSITLNALAMRPCEEMVGDSVQGGLSVIGRCRAGEVCGRRFRRLRFRSRGSVQECS
jgi:hypothetical protein